MVMNDLYTHLEDIKTYLAFAIQQKGHSTRENEPSNNETDISRQDAVASKNDNTYFITTATDSVQSSNILDSDHLVTSEKNSGDENITNVEMRIGEHWTISTPSNDSSGNENHVLKVGEHQQTSETSETSMNDDVASVTVITNNITEQSSLNPQETQVLTNMIRVLLEENKSGTTNTSLPT